MYLFMHSHSKRIEKTIIRPCTLIQTKMHMFIHIQYKKEEIHAFINIHKLVFSKIHFSAHMVFVCISYISLAHDPRLHKISTSYMPLVSDPLLHQVSTSYISLVHDPLLRKVSTSYISLVCDPLLSKVSTSYISLVCDPML